ncbi:MAG: hypothetical protein K2X32_04930 [Phycisphaerales bacterium]|nr:hypothetical protein [Phycisphaerales bacterium]
MRVTILAVVDPLADELQPIYYPRLIALGLVAWVLSGMIAVLLSWRPALGVLVGLWSDARIPPVPHWWDDLIGGLLIIAMISSAAFWRPQAGLRPWMTALAILATLLHIPLMLLVSAEIDRASTTQIRTLADIWGAPGTSGQVAAISSSVDRILVAVILVSLLACIRPVAVALIARSLAIRLGRVDRQTVLAMTAALFAAVLGDLLGLLGTHLSPHAIADFLQHLGFVMLLGGASLFSLGLVGASIDFLRVARTILSPAPSARQVMGE